MSRHTIEYGVHHFDDDTISGGNCNLVISPIANSLEVNTFSAVVISEQNLEEDFQRNTKLTYSFNGSIFGVFYIQKIKQQTSIEYKITATSIIGILSESDHYGGMYSGITVKELIADICGNVAYSIKTSLQDIKLYGHLPIATRRDNLIQVLMAIGAVVKTDRFGVIQITGLYDQPTGIVDEDHLFVGSVPQNNTKVTDIVLLEHQYLQVATEDKVLYEGNALQNDIITFNVPMYDLRADGFTILESNVNYAKISAGSGKLVGKEYKHNTREVTRHLADAEFPNVKRVEEATLVSLVNSSVVANNLANYLAKSFFEIDSDSKHTGYFPGDIVRSINPRSREEIDAFVSEVEMSFGSFIRAKGQWIKGYVPHKSGADQFLDKRLLITENTTWTVPDGVTSIRAVIVGGGDGGQSGRSGQSGTAGGSGHMGTSGQSGEPGLGGNGGKIYELQLDVVPGQQFVVSIGAGGRPSSSGAPTSFGEYSSDMGEVSSYGYIDVTTGETFGNAGENGVKPDPVAVTSNVSRYGMSAYFRLGEAPGLNVYKSCGTKSDGTVTAGSTKLELVSNGDYDYTVYFSLHVSGQKARDGKTLPDADDATNYGGGGNGGHGGQGGQGGHGYVVENVPQFSQSGATWNIVYRNNNLESCPGGSGGGAGKAGSGKSGCVLLFYSEPKKIQSGFIKEKNGRVFIDATGKLFVV